MSTQDFFNFHSSSIRLRFLLERNDGGFWGDDPDETIDNYIILRSTEQTVDGRWKIEDPARRKMSLVEFSKVRLIQGDLVITKSSGSSDHIGKTSIVTQDIEELKCGFSNFMQRLRVNNNVDPRFVAYLLNSDLGRTQFRILSTTTTGLGNLTSEILNDILVPYASFTHQCAIADYLDRETARLDSLIAAKERLLNLLTEKRRAVITHAIMRGLNPDVPMRDSGVEWLGEIPGHWDVEYARWLFREIDERSEAGQEELLSVSHLTGVTSRKEKDVNMFMAESNEGYKVCQPGDLVINTLWAWMGAMGVSWLHGIVSPAYNVYRSLGQYESNYIDFLVRMPVFAQEVTRYSKGVWSSRLRLYPEGFFEVILPVPPIDEQRAIVDYLVGQIQKIDRLAKLAQDTIDLLKERRAALIAAVVSGQIDVRV